MISLSGDKSLGDKIDTMNRMRISDRGGIQVNNLGNGNLLKSKS